MKKVDKKQIRNTLHHKLDQKKQQDVQKGTKELRTTCKMKRTVIVVIQR